MVIQKLAHPELVEGRAPRSIRVTLLSRRASLARVLRQAQDERNLLYKNRSGWAGLVIQEQLALALRGGLLLPTRQALDHQRVQAFGVDGHDDVGGLFAEAGLVVFAPA